LSRKESRVTKKGKAKNRKGPAFRAVPF